MAERHCCGDYEYVLTPDATAEITKYNGSGAVVCLPELLDGYRVNSIGADAFALCKFLTSIELPDDVTRIGKYAFYGCEKLASVNLPAGLQLIGKHAFSGCYALTEIELPEGVTAIDDWAFFSCISLTHIGLSDSLTTIGCYAFSWCRKLENITLPETLIRIGRNAFDECISLENLTVPDGVIVIGPAAFIRCRKLTLHAHEDSWAARYASKYGIRFAAIPGHAGQTALKCVETNAGLYWYVVLPDGSAQITAYEGLCARVAVPALLEGHPVAEIGEYAFHRHKLLEYIELPEGLKTIGNGAFWYCRKLKGIKLPESLMTIGEDAFTGCESLDEAALRTQA